MKSRSNSSGRDTSAKKSDKVGVIDLSKHIQRNFDKVMYNQPHSRGEKVMQAINS
jgi:hypothetical protein